MRCVLVVNGGRELQAEMYTVVMERVEEEFPYVSQICL